MQEVSIKCSQCAWVSCLAADRIPRYGARIRCPQCDCLHSVDPQPTVSLDEDRFPLPKPADPGEATQLHDYQINRDPMPLPKLPIREPVVSQAREVISTWLSELERGRTDPLTLRLLFSEFTDELTHIFALWKAANPGEKSIKIFREQLLAELGGERNPPAGDQLNKTPEQFRR